MKTKVKRGKAIIGIALAAIMLASVFAAMVPTSARDATGRIEQGDVVYMGEKGLDVSIALASTTTGTFYGIADSTADGEIITVADATDFNVPTTVDEGPYNQSSRQGTTADIIVKEPEITADVLVAGDSMVDKSIPKGTEITIRASPNFGGILKEAGTDNWGQIKIKLTDPDGVTTTTNIDADATEIDTTYDTTDWDTGPWEVKISTDKATCNELDIPSSELEFTIRSEDLAISAVDDEIGKGEAMVLAVNGNPSTYYYLIVTGIKRVARGEDTVTPEIVDTDDVKALDTAGDAYPENTEEGETNLAAWIETGSDGVADIKIDTTGADERTYTIKVYEIPAGTGVVVVPNPPTVPEASATFNTDADVDGVDTEDDEVKVKVEKAKVTFDLPASVIIGEEVTIKGSISAGDEVDIVIKDQEVVADDEDVDENNEFEVKWDTEGYTTGSYTIEGYINCPINTRDHDDYDDEDDDGKTTIRLVEPGLTAEQPRKVIAEGDDYELKGTATGVDEVDYILIGPKGWKTGATANIGGGILKSSSSVSDNEFSEEETMTDGLDTGMWIAMIFAPGRDAEYEGTGQAAGDLTLGRLGVVDGKNQDQIVAIIEDAMTLAGSDDLFVMMTFKVESAYVELNPVASVAAGEPLNVSGTTNREPDTSITISTFAGPMDLDVGLADVTWPTASEGVFTATIDTTDAVPGTYTLEADDGDGNTDTETVNIGEAAPPTPTPEVEVTPTPEVEVTPTPEVEEPTPTPRVEEEPTPTPTPEPPGFEAVFAIAGLLAVAYLVLRKRR